MATGMGPNICVFDDRLVTNGATATATSAVTAATIDAMT